MFVKQNLRNRRKRTKPHKSGGAWYCNLPKPENSEDIWGGTWIHGAFVMTPAQGFTLVRSAGGPRGNRGRV
jgi:hypothetical protein